MKRAKKVKNKTFYGWRIVYVSMIMVFVSSGVGWYGNAVILDPLRNLHGWNKGTISAAITIYFFIVGVAGVFVGKKVDDLGSKTILVFGSIINGVGLVALSLIDQVWQLFAAYALMAVGFACISQITISAVITNWFVKKRGYALSIAMTGITLGGIFMVPLESYSITFLGIRDTLILMGIFVCVGHIPLSLIFIKQHPSEIGQLPDGESIPSEIPNDRDKNDENSIQQRKWTQKQAIRTIPFWAIVFAFLLGISSLIAISTHQISFLSHYLGANEAAIMVSIANGISMVGRIVIGIVIDKYDKRIIVIFILLCQAFAVFIMALIQNHIVLYICTMIFGLTIGSANMLLALLVGDCFGMVSFGSVYGLANLFIQCGAAFGPLIAGLIYDMSQNYHLAFIIFASASVVASLSVVFAKPPNLQMTG